MNPWVVSYVIFWASNIFLVIMYVRQSRKYRHEIKMNGRLMGMLDGSFMFATALAERGITVPCDDCGNMLGPNDNIVILTRPTGGVYVGHKSHNREGDWGYS